MSNGYELFTLAAICDYGLDPYEFRVMHRVARRGDCWEGAKQIAAGCLMSYAKARAVLGLLEDAGLVECEKRIGQSDIYRVKPIAAWPSPEVFAQIKAGPTVLLHSTPQLSRSTPAQLPNGTPQLLHSTPQLSGSGPQLCDSYHEGNPRREPNKETQLRKSISATADAVRPVPETGQAVKSELEQVTSGRKQEGGPRKKTATADPAELLELRARLRAHREGFLGEPLERGYSINENKGIRAIWEKITQGRIVERDAVECFNHKYDNWVSAGMRFTKPNWFYIASDVEAFIKGRDHTPTKPARPGYISQAEINKAAPGKLIL